MSTGANGCLGQEVARVGARLALLGRRTEKAHISLADLVDLSGIWAAPSTDLLDPNALMGTVDLALKHLGKLDVLVNTGSTMRGPLWPKRY